MTDDDQPPASTAGAARGRSGSTRRSTAGRDGGLRVAIGDARGRSVEAPGLARWLSDAAPPTAAGFEVSVALVSDRYMRRLNHRYRGVAHATDVLSFPAAERPERARSGSGRQVPPRTLGDIVIATGVARRQARRAGLAYGTELRLLALHGLLHLLGFDHEIDDGRMARAERRLRQRAGLPVGLIERGARR